MESGAKSTDVVIVGCGAGGGVIAKELGESGLSIVVLEAGPRFDPSKDFETDVPTSRSGARTRFAGATRDATATRRAVLPFGMTTSKGSGLDASLRRHHPAASRERLPRAQSGRVAQDWPFRYEDLEPYYTRVEWELGVSGPSGDERNPFEPPRSRRYPDAASSVQSREPGPQAGGGQARPSFRPGAARDSHARLAGSGRLCRCGHLPARLPDPGEIEHRCHVRSEGRGDGTCRDQT